MPLPPPQPPRPAPPGLSFVVGSTTTPLGEAAPVRAFFEGLGRPPAGTTFPCLAQELACGELPAGRVSDALAELDRLARTHPGPTPRTSDGRDLLGILRAVLRLAEEEGFAVLLV